MSKPNYEPIRDYLSFEDYLDKAGYKQYRPKVNTFWTALLKASKHQGRSSFLNKMLDVYFTKLRQQKKEKHRQNEFQKQNSRHHIYTDAANHTKTSGTCGIESDGCTTNR